MENDNILKKVFKAIWKGISAFFKGLYTFLYSLKFIVYIPVITICSSIIGFCIVAIVKTLLGLVLPVSMNNGFIEMLIFAVIFVSLNVYIFNRKMDEDLTINWKKPLILNYIPVIVCMALCIFLALDDFSLQSLDYILAWDIYDPEYIDEIYPLLLPFYAPHLWLGCLTKEFLISTPICMFINCAASVGICLVVGNRRDKGL